MTPEMTSEEKRFRDCMLNPSGYSDEDINELKKLPAATIGQFDASWQRAAQFKASIELISAIRRFDKTSAALIKRTNYLTLVILVLTVASLVIALLK